MIIFFRKGASRVIAVGVTRELSIEEKERLTWLFDGAKPLKVRSIKGRYVGPRKEMVTPWSTNAVEIAANMGVTGIERIEEYERVATESPVYDKMLQSLYAGLGQRLFTTSRKPEPIVYIDDIHAYNLREGLSLSSDEEQYLTDLAKRLGRPLTDSEVFGFSQVNSEHCRHKIFNGTFVIDGEEQPESLFSIIRSTSRENPRRLVSAYKDNVAFVEGPEIDLFYPTHPERPDYFAIRKEPTVLSLKAETHNFPTTVEPFNGAATGTGGEIRDRLGGGRASLPLAGTAVYMTSYPRYGAGMRPWEMMLDPRVWLYQTPSQLLIKASNGASDFGNKFGQPLICGSVLTFEHGEGGRIYAYDKVIMLAGGVGYALSRDALKGVPEPGQAVVLMGGDNYRIGMGGGAVSSADTGEYDNAIELNAVQRANPEMQKRVSNVIRALAESETNPIISIHDHGAGGHLNALSELVEETGGHINMDALPVGDNTLSAKEIVGNESQERMGMVMKKEDLGLVEAIASRERAPMFVVGETTDDHRFVFSSTKGGKETRPIDLEMEDMFGKAPKTVMRDRRTDRTKAPVGEIDDNLIGEYLEGVLRLEAVACKDWLTNKVDRSVTGRIARQQCQGALQLPLSDCGVAALDYTGRFGIATSIGHAPQAALVDAAEASRLAIAEALTNLVGAPLKGSLEAVSLSANWMWPCKNEGEDAALYDAVKACADFAKALGINIPTGKDSLSMTQKYPDGQSVMAPGTVIISAAGEVTDVRKVVSPVVKNRKSRLYHIDFSDGTLSLGGSALAQTLGRLGADTPRVAEPARFAATFDAVQQLVAKGLLLAAHDVSAGGLIVTLLEMVFANTSGGLDIDLTSFGCETIATTLFAENPALVIQVAEKDARRVEKILGDSGAHFRMIGRTAAERVLSVANGASINMFAIDRLRDAWYETSALLDAMQTRGDCAAQRFLNYKKQPVRWRLPEGFTGRLSDIADDDRRPRAAIIREKGVNGDREMAYSLWLAGFEVKDVHMTDLMTGRETLDDISMIVFCGGFSNSDVLGSAKGWAGAFRYNETARKALERFYSRPDTLSLGICNGCQLMIELDLLGINREGRRPAKMLHNESHKFESQFLSVDIAATPAVMLRGLEGSRLGIWVAHGEGRFDLPGSLSEYNVAVRYAYKGYPGNPNGSRGAVAGLCSADGRHLAMMPHLERAVMPWQCGVYPEGRADEVTPWLTAFANARKWLTEKR